MSATVWLGVDTMEFPQGGGHLWVYLNWALGLRAVGCRVVWLEPYEPGVPAAELDERVRSLRARLEPYGLADAVAVCPKVEELSAAHRPDGCVPLESAGEADLLLNLAYYTHVALLPRFRRTALVEIDPGLAQMWIEARLIEIPRYDVRFTTGETVGGDWQYAPPCAALDWWPVTETPPGARFSTVSSWHTGTWYTEGGEWRPNNKRDGFLPFLDLPEHTAVPLELALALGPTEGEERARLERKGWRVVLASSVSSTPWDYQQYIQESSGEFSCAKPSCRAFQNAWISDRTLCYLASGKPAVVEHTGPSRILPDGDGLFRFRTIGEAAGFLEEAAADPQRHGLRGRALVEEHFDARKVVAGVLERALP